MITKENTVLLVDDEPNVTQGLMRHLRQEPYRVLTVSSAQDALEIIRKEKIDLMITDEKMPNMTGAELVSKVRKDYPQIVCMILSGQASIEGTIRAINEGEIYRFLKKPCDPLDLITNIRLALEQRDLIVESRKLLDQYQQKTAHVKKLEKEHPALFAMKYDEDGNIIVGASVKTLSPSQLVSDIKKELMPEPSITAKEKNQ